MAVQMIGFGVHIAFLCAALTLEGAAGEQGAGPPQQQPAHAPA